jgi:hypothetical protein
MLPRFSMAPKSLAGACAAGSSDYDQSCARVETSKVIWITRDNLLTVAPGADDDVSIGDVAGPTCCE